MQGWLRFVCANKVCCEGTGLEMTTKKDDNIHNVVSYENTVQASSKRKGPLQRKSGPVPVKKGSQVRSRNNDENEGDDGNKPQIRTSTTKLRNHRKFT